MPRQIPQRFSPGVLSMAPSQHNLWGEPGALLFPGSQSTGSTLQLHSRGGPQVVLLGRHASVPASPLLILGIFSIYIYIYIFVRFYPPCHSGRLLNTHNDLEGAVKVLASAECSGIGAKTPGRTVVSSHLQTTRLPLSRGGQCERTCAKHHVGKLSALRRTACWLRTNGNSL